MFDKPKELPLLINATEGEERVVIRAIYDGFRLLTATLARAALKPMTPEQQAENAASLRVCSTFCDAYYGMHPELAATPGSRLRGRPPMSAEDKARAKLEREAAARKIAREQKLSEGFFPTWDYTLDQILKLAEEGVITHVRINEAGDGGWKYTDKLTETDVRI